jgi:hypothetical protein
MPSRSFGDKSENITENIKTKRIIQFQNDKEDNSDVLGEPIFLDTPDGRDARSLVGWSLCILPYK